MGLKCGFIKKKLSMLQLVRWQPFDSFLYLLINGHTCLLIFGLNSIQFILFPPGLKVTGQSSLVWPAVQHFEPLLACCETLCVKGCDGTSGLLGWVQLGWQWSGCSLGGTSGLPWWVQFGLQWSSWVQALDAKGTSARSALQIFYCLCWLVDIIWQL